MLPDGEGVKEGLGRVLVAAVARIDDARRVPVGQNFSRTSESAANHHDVAVHRLNIGECIMKRFAFHRARARGSNRQRIRAQALRGKLKRNTRARARFKEEVDDEPSLEQGYFLDPAFAFLYSEKLRRRIEDQFDFIAKEVLHRHQVASSPFYHVRHSHRWFHYPSTALFAACGVRARRLLRRLRPGARRHGRRVACRSICLNNRPESAIRAGRGR